MHQPQPGSTSGIDSGLQEANAIANAIAPQQMQFLATITSIIVILLGWLSVVLEVFLRYDFGERYLSYFRLWFAYGLLTTFWFIPTAISIASFSLPDQNSPLIGLFTLAFIGLSVWHRVRIWLRYKNHIAWHSMSFGISRLSALNLPVMGHDDWGLYRWYEPFICFAIGNLLMASQIDAPTGFVIVLASIALFIKNNIIYYQHRSRILDLIDARIEGMYFNEEAFNMEKEGRAGIAVMDVVFPKLVDNDSGDFEDTVRTSMGIAGVYASVHSNSPDTPRSPSSSGMVTDFAATVADTLSADGDTPTDVHED